MTLQQDGSPEHSTADLDGLWTTPAAVQRRYSKHGDAYRPGPSIYAFRQPAIDWYAHALGRLDWTGVRAVLDAGCGRGAYLPHLAAFMQDGARLLGLDFSSTAVTAAREQPGGAALLTGDVQALPFGDAAFDLVLSAHMLYHVPDIRAAIREFRRVLRPGGELAIIVGSARDQHRLDELFVTAGGAFPLQRFSDRFTSDNAPEYCSGIFDHVESYVVHPELVITDPAAVVAYFTSMRSVAEPSLRPGVSWDDLLRTVEQTVADTLVCEGAFRVSEEIALLRCR